MIFFPSRFQLLSLHIHTPEFFIGFIFHASLWPALSKKQDFEPRKKILLIGEMFDIALRTAAKKVLGLIKMEEIFFDWRRFFLMLGSGCLN